MTKKNPEKIEKLVNNFIKEFEKEFRRLKFPRFHNLMNGLVQNEFKRYLKETGKYPNWGTQIRKEFINFIENQINNKSITKKEQNNLKILAYSIKKINENQEIKEILIDKIKNSNLSHNEISKEINEYGIHISETKIGRISRNDLGIIQRIKNYNWSFLDRDNDGHQLSKEESIVKASDYLSNNFLNKDFREKYGIEEGRSPSVYLDDKHFQNFISAINKKNFTYTDVIEYLGLEKNIEHGKWLKLDYGEDGRKLTKDESLDVAAEILTDIVSKENFKEKYKLEMGETPSSYIKDPVFSSFIYAINKREYTFLEIVDRAGLKVKLNDFRDTKWNMLKRRDDGTLLTKDESMDIAANILNNFISNDHFKTNFLPEDGIAPNIYTNDKEFQKFVRIIEEMPYTYLDVVERLGLKRYREEYDWSILRENGEGKLLTKEESLNVAVDILERFINDQNFKLKHRIEDGKAPVVSIEDKEFNSFIWAIKRLPYSYNDVIECAGLEKNYDPYKWSNLDYNEFGEPLTTQESLKVAATIFENFMKDAEFKEKNNLGINEVPPFHLNDSEFKSYVKAIGRRDYTYNEVVESAGYTPSESLIMKDIGIDLHWVCKQSFIQHTRDKDCISFNETYPSKFSEDLFKKFSNNHCDNSIIIDDKGKVNNLSKEMREFLKKRKDIEIILVEYYLGNSEQSIRNHSIRGYQGQGKFLIQIPSHAKQVRPIKIDVPDKENTIIMDPMSFADFMGYKGKIRQDFLFYMNKAREAFWAEDNSIELLREQAYLSKKIVLEKYNYRQKDLEKFLEEKDKSIDILKYRPCKSNISRYLIKEDDK